MEEVTFVGLQGRRGQRRREEEGRRGAEKEGEGGKEGGREEGGRSHFTVSLTGKVHHFSSSFLTPAVKA